MIVKIVFLLVMVSSCKATKTIAEDKKAYRVLNAFLDYYIEKTNRGVFLSPLVIDKENHAIIDVFDKEGKIHEDICGDSTNTINISKSDFNSYIEKRHINKWNYKQIKNKDVVKKLILEKPAQIEYKKAKENNMLKRENEWVTYKYILWNNKSNVPLITLGYPIFSNNDNHALLYMTRHNGGGYVFILKKEISGKWKVVCEKNLFQY